MRPVICDDVIRILKPEPDSHFRLRACPECNGDNVAYVQYKQGNQEPWRVRCLDCGHTVDRRAAGRHEAQGHWNREGDITGGTEDPSPTGLFGMEGV